MPILKIVVPKKFKTELAERAELEHTTMSEIVRSVIGKYLDGRVVTVDMSPDKWVKAPNWTLTATDEPKWKE